MLEQWIGKVVTYYLMGEAEYRERTLVAVDARGIYAQEPDDSKTTYFVPYSSIQSMSITAD